MTCYQHPESPAVAFCRSCGRPLCSLCQRPAEGTVFCQEHLPATGAGAPPRDYAANPYAQPAAGVQTSPGLAFALGLIPGVGAIYNAQYLKGFIHVAILGVLISILSSNHVDRTGLAPFLGLLTAVWYFYMPFEAYHTARKRQMGIPVDEWSSLLPKTRPDAVGAGRVPVGPVILIAIGVLFLLDNLGLLELGQVLRYWPLILIGIGVYSLYARLSGPFTDSAPPSPPRSGPGAPSGDVLGVPRER